MTATTAPQAVLLKMAAEKEFGDATRFDTQMVKLPHPDATARLFRARALHSISLRRHSLALLKLPAVVNSAALQARPDIEYKTLDISQIGSIKAGYRFY